MERRQGRRFDEDDAEEGSDINAMKILLGLFDNIETVLQNAALTAALMHYLFTKSQEYFSLLFYYTMQKYLRVNETINTTRNYNHINMEIFTVFIHPKSILHIPFQSTEIIAKIEENIDSQDCIIYFNKVSKHVVTEIISKYLERFKEIIRLGLESYSYIHNIHQHMNRTQELSMLNNLHNDIHNSLIRNQKSRCLPLQKQDLKTLQIPYDFQITAITTAMHTQYEYFQQSKKYCFVVSNTENTINLKTFLSYTPTKMSNKQRIRGHSFEETSLSKVGFCIVCNLMFWGSHPHCLYCRNCMKAIHRECKDMVKYCQIDAKKNKKTESSEPELEKEKEKAIDGDGVLEQMTSDLTKIIDEHTTPFDPKMLREIRNSPLCTNAYNNHVENDYIDSPKYKEKPRIPVKPPKLKLQEWKQQSPPFTIDQNKKNSIKHTKSMNVKSERANLDPVNRSKSARSPSPKKIFSKESNRFQIRSTSEDLVLTVKPLPISEIDDDDEMNVLETFEPEIELQSFLEKNEKADVKDKGEYQRLLVLMEFHHKIRFTRMTLKRFKYFLVDPWIKMEEFLDLFDSLSLYCIDKLYQLIGSLVNVLDTCKIHNSYKTEVAEKVINWLSNHDDQNLNCWLQLSTDLCCTNILHNVKENWTEQRQLSPKLNDLFSIEINRLVIIDQLANMRPLLFNLPMIVKKIVKDLRMFSKFEVEAKVWDQVGHKLSRLPQLIDKRCMPLVDLINNGVIVNSNLKYKRYKYKKENSKEMEIYIKNFPNTAFKNKFIDFQFVKISNLRQSYNSMQPHVYIKEETEAAVICYENEMILLQKDNEKFVLKQFKSVGINRLFPLIPFEMVHVTKQNVKDVKIFQYELTVLLMNQAILVQILFKEERTRDMWFDHIIKRSINIPKEMKLPESRCSTSTITGDTVSIDSVDTRETPKCQHSDVRFSKISSIRTSLSKSSGHLQTTVDLFSNELLIDTNLEQPFQGINKPDHKTSNEFMCGYMNLLKDYVNVGSEMLNQSQYIDSDLLLQRDILSMNLPKIQDITKDMEALIKSQEQVPFESESSDESTMDEDIVPKIYSQCIIENERSQSVQIYIEDIITEAMQKVKSNIKSGVSDTSEYAEK